MLVQIMHEANVVVVFTNMKTEIESTLRANEVIGMAEMLVRYAGVNPKDIKGMRAPFLAVGGDTMFRMLNRYGLYYDSSMSVPVPSWPYASPGAQDAFHAWFWAPNPLAKSALL